ncbi:cytochrome P450 [Actinospica sp.]|jgi:cytochrome P450|uniref:cytochrome P450 n=1 Tax=Actinospica sp. TaxID=1872142 RepID=UPI002C0D12C3|nr:cytochrome P450 [Actinospica sp.]HWG26725.1 cytochrome P450 [Actinospica sp.]
MDERPEAPPLAPHAVVDGRAQIALNIHGAEFCRENYRIYDELRSRCPVAWSTELGGYWLLTDYDSVFEATRDDELFYSSAGASVRDDSGVTEDQVAMLTVMPPIQTDPPETGKMRALTVKHLSPAAAERMEPEIREIANELIDSFIERGEADIVAELTTPLPAKVILRLMNFDDSRWAEWVVYVHTLIHGAEGGESLEAVAGGMRQAIGEEMRRRAELGLSDDDMVGSILTAKVDGRELTAQEKFGYILLLLFGGMDTTSGLTGNTLVELAGNPDLKRQLIDNPDLMGTATEEFLRHGSPTQGLGRTVSRDVDFHGQQLKADEKIMLMWAAANRDPAVFEEPDTIKLDRHPNRHMAFGVGQHRCLGSNLARTMFKVMITAILDRLPDFTMIDDEPVRFSDAANVYAPRSLRIRFTPGEPTGVKAATSTNEGGAR